MPLLPLPSQEGVGAGRDTGCTSHPLPPLTLNLVFTSFHVMGTCVTHHISKHSSPFTTLLFWGSVGQMGSSPIPHTLSPRGSHSLSVSPFTQQPSPWEPTGLQAPRGLPSVGGEVRPNPSPPVPLPEEDSGPTPKAVMGSCEMGALAGLPPVKSSGSSSIHNGTGSALRAGGTLGDRPQSSPRGAASLGREGQ